MTAVLDIEKQVDKAEKTEVIQKAGRLYNNAGWSVGADRVRNAGGVVQPLSQDDRIPHELSDCGKMRLRTAVFVGEAGASADKAKLIRYIEEHPEFVFIHSYEKDNAKDPDRAEKCSALDQLMRGVQSGNIQCIVVADFTDLTGDYVETAYYIQNYFQYMNVRYIAVNDDFDSTRKSDMAKMAENAFKKASDDRSKQQSKTRCDIAKIRASKPGAMPNGTAPFGYQVELIEGQKSYIPDSEFSPYVRIMFKWALLGISSKQIAERLTVLGIPTPGQLRNGKPADPSKWDSHSVLKILQNPNYTGDIYLGRMQQALYKSQPRRQTTTEEWTVRKNAHEPMVSREDFEIVQKQIKENCKNPPKDSMGRR